LHASRLQFRHPETGRDACYESPLADDMVALLADLRSDAAQANEQLT
jgi:hypothetical protein